MASHFPLKDLFDEVVAWYVAQGDSVDHRFGSKALFEHRNANTFVWVPKLTRRTDNEATRAIDRHKINFGAEHIVEVHCWGATEELAYLMAESLLFATRELGRADVSFLGAEWHDFEEQGATELGSVFVVEIAVRAAFIRRYTPIAAYAGTAQTVTPAEQPTTEIQSVTVEVHATENVSQDGTVMGSDSVDVEFSSEFSEDYS